MASTSEELRLDVEELTGLLQSAVRPRVKDFLLSEIQRCERLMADPASASSGQRSTRPTPAAETHVLESKTVIVPEKYYKDITDYAWDQSEKFMKIYVSFTGLAGLAKENIKCEFTEKSFRLRVENLADKNYQCHVGFLWGKIVPAESYHKVKSDCILLMLKKVETKTWAFVTEREGKEDKKKKSSIGDDKKEEDPSAGLMNMLKKMYDEGDDDMKRTIAKSYSESRNKTGGDMF